jgi:hypothetical protein
MRLNSSILAAVLVLTSACATAPPPASAPTPVSAPVEPGIDGAEIRARAQSERLAAFLRRSADAAPNLESVERALGPADLTRREGAGATLTYRFEQCALLLVFAADTANTMRLASAHPGPRRTGDPAPSLEACSRAAIDRGAPGAPS